MKNLKMPFLKQLTIRNWFIVVFLLMSLAGFFDSVYLIWQHGAGLPPPCPISSFFDCGEVFKSKYSYIGGVPLSLLGAIFYFAIFSLMIFYAYFARNVIVKLAAVLAFLGFLASVYFVYLQVFVIKALCPYCLFSALVSIILFVLSLIILRLEKAKTLN